MSSSNNVGFSSFFSNDTADDEDRNAADNNELRSSLKKRGKGSYTCPQGLGCTKGGVAADGSLAVFQRNSEFRTHLQKHEKAFKCNLPGCPTKKGFARIDQLRRHQETTRHKA
ncbi:hypothetical protein B0T25DRAFT_560062 [Lasiosphaeria hispida]|uniref:C2H2-type domain-containing protein n=1 Tax=Lasiosphaeria hispida TaxID=260671 RepID=A0AAJ0H7Q8_9PEZI|nr:hypothetical protein B0T25DRAFT_560062 [Lasiosphaeria hispida]